MSNQSDQVFLEWDETFRAVIALYLVLKTDYYARLRMRKSVPVSHLDFICDVETRVRQAFYEGDVHPDHYSVWTEIMLLPEDYQEPVTMYRWLMGEYFVKYDLGVSGAYRGLYWKVKNDQMRAALTGEDSERGEAVSSRDSES